HAGRVHPETPLASAEEVTVFSLLADLAEQASENRLVHGGVAFGAQGGFSGFGLLIELGVELGIGGGFYRRAGLGRSCSTLIARWLAPTGFGAPGQLQLTADQRELAMGIAPFAQAQVVEEIPAAPAAQRA